MNIKVRQLAFSEGQHWQTTHHNRITLMAAQLSNTDLVEWGRVRKIKSEKEENSTVNLFFY